MLQITLEQAIRNAVAAEEGAERFYRLLAQRTNNADAAAFLNHLADQELQHANSIRHFGRRHGAGGALLSADEYFENVEIAPNWLYCDDVTLDEAIGLAIQNEQRAALFYDALASSTEGEVKAFFEKLLRDEGRHADELKGFIKTELE